MFLVEQSFYTLRQNSGVYRKSYGVFVEIPEYNITGLIEKDPRELVKYHKGDPIKVQIDKFDWDSKKQPYRRNKDGIITEVNIKPIFVEV